MLLPRSWLAIKNLIAGGNNVLRYAETLHLPPVQCSSARCGIDDNTVRRLAAIQGAPNPLSDLLSGEVHRSQFSTEGTLPQRQIAAFDDRYVGHTGKFAGLVDIV